MDNKPTYFKSPAVDALREKLHQLRPYLIEGSIEGEADINIIKSRLEVINLFSSFLLTGKLPKLYRYTINKRVPPFENNRLNEISKLKYPPKESVKRYGRANMIGESVLYATFNPLTALNEMRPEIGDYITESQWNQKEETQLCYSPIFLKTGDNKSGILNETSIHMFTMFMTELDKKPKEQGQQVYDLMKFIAECFSKEAKYGNHLDYFLSAHIASKILYVFENGEAEAILYPSVKENLTLNNICIKPEVFDNKYTLVEVNESIIRANPKTVTGYYGMQGTGWSRNFEDGLIQWR